MKKYFEIENETIVGSYTSDKKNNTSDREAPNDFNADSQIPFLNEKGILEYRDLGDEEKNIGEENKKRELNIQRDIELQNIVIDDILVSEDIIKIMAVKLSTLGIGEKVNWINTENKVIQLDKKTFTKIIKGGVKKIEEIYFRYRGLKNNI